MILVGLLIALVAVGIMGGLDSWRSPAPLRASEVGLVLPAHGKSVEVLPDRWRPVLEAEASAMVQPDAKSTGAFRLHVPFRTQKDGGRFQGSNCGPAALGMALEAYGSPESNDDLRWRTHTYQGTAGRRGGTALEHMAAVAEDFGLEARSLFEEDAFHRWTIEQVRAELDLGHVVIPLVKYRLLPGHEAAGVGYDHYIVIHGSVADRFLYHDPAYEWPEDGASRWIDTADLSRAMVSAFVPSQAVALAPGARSLLLASPLPVLP